MVKDSISALVDGECSPDELDRILDEMERSPELKASWSRLCLVRDAHEGIGIRKSQPCICAGVMARLDAQERSSSSRVVPLVAAPRLRAYWKPLAGLAAVASIAAVAVVLNLQQQSGAVPVPGFAPQAGSPVNLPAAGGRPGSLQLVSASPDEIQRPVLDDDLRQYLIEHSNALADRGMGATLSYARFAAHSVGESTAQPVNFSVPGDQP